MSNDKPIKDGVYGYVSGTVGRSFETKNGRAFEIEVKDDRQQYGDRWTIWGDLPVNEGDRASVKGWLAISRDTYEKDGETKVTIKRAVNKPELAAHEATGNAPAAVQDEPWATTAPGTPPSAGDVWNAPQSGAQQGGYGDDTPF